MERIWKEMVVAVLNYCAVICLGELRQTFELLSECPVIRPRLEPFGSQMQLRSVIQA